MIDWHPIESAPVDRNVLVWDGSDFWRAYKTEIGTWVRMPGAYGMKRPPTHWAEITPPHGEARGT